MKKLDLYILKRFFVLLIMTLIIVIFVLVMQFLWMHVKDLVGKGIPLVILAEFFIYAIFTVVPLALPLAILLASLMTFGNLGENFELTAIKAAGISLFRIMRPLIVAVVLLSIGAFQFSNLVLPTAQQRLWALVFSIRQTSPELDIPVGEFFSGIDGITMLVRERDGRMLRNLMIYDFSDGFNNARVTTADSGLIQLTADNQFLMLTLFSGEMFENVQQQSARNRNPAAIPYRRETFGMRQILLEFNTELQRLDEDMLRDSHVSKTVAQLRHDADSVNTSLEIRLAQQAQEFVHRHFLGREHFGERNFNRNPFVDFDNYDIELLLQRLSPDAREMAATQALALARDRRDHVQYQRFMFHESIMYVRRHLIEKHRRFTMAFVCLVFFFIGAPLGAIIRKGGLGLPTVISVSFFVIYYMIDTGGMRLAREGVWEVYQGMWLSSMVLFPIGIFLTYKAAVDATLFSYDHYKNIWERAKNRFLEHKNKKTNKTVLS